MSDTLAFLNRSMIGVENFPRYFDLINDRQEPEETPEEVISRFDALRRK